MLLQNYNTHRQEPLFALPPGAESILNSLRPRPRHTAYCVSRRTAFRRGRGYQAKAMYVLVTVPPNPGTPNCTVTPSALNVVSGGIPLVEQPGTNNAADLLNGFNVPEEYSPTSTSEAFSGSVMVLPAVTVIFPASIILTLPAPPPAPALSIMLGTSLVQGADKRSYAPPPRWDYVVFMHCVQPPYDRLCITTYTVRFSLGAFVQLKVSWLAACPVQSTPAS